MSIIVNDPAMSHLLDEKSVTVGDSGGRVHIHPWNVGDILPFGVRENAQVYISIGDLTKSGDVKKGKHSKYRADIIDRADFVEAILAVFPELVRAE